MSELRVPSLPVGSQTSWWCRKAPTILSTVRLQGWPPNSVAMLLHLSLLQEYNALPKMLGVGTVHRHQEVIHAPSPPPLFVWLIWLNYRFSRFSAFWRKIFRFGGRDIEIATRHNLIVRIILYSSWFIWMGLMLAFPRYIGRKGERQSAHNSRNSKLQFNQL